MIPFVTTAWVYMCMWMSRTCMYLVNLSLYIYAYTSKCKSKDVLIAVYGLNWHFLICHSLGGRVMLIVLAVTTCFWVRFPRKMLWVRSVPGLDIVIYVFYSREWTDLVTGHCIYTIYIHIHVYIYYYYFQL